MEGRSDTIRALARIALVIGVVAVGVLSLAPQPETAAPGGDKAHHLLAYCALGMAGLASFGPRLRLAILAALFLYGGLIELAQAALTETRSGEWADAGANLLGLGAAAGAFFLAGLALRRGPD